MYISYNNYITNKIIQEMIDMRTYDRFHKITLSKELGENSYIYETNYGIFCVSEDGIAVTKVDLLTQDEYNMMIKDNHIRIKETPLLRKTIQQLEEYFTGKRKNFDLPLNPPGTEFQKKVWQALCKVPYGSTCSYKDIAEEVNNPKAYRAVGLANNKNPIMIIIPCHRVIGVNGDLVGYGGGIELKKKLLELEQ